MMKKLDAVLFDMDGLLLDTESRNMCCAAETAREMGCEVDIPTMAKRVCGVRRMYAVEAYASVLPASIDAARFYARKTELLRQALQKEPPKPMKGAVELLAWLNAHHIPCVLATATKRESAEETLRAAGLWTYLTHAVTGDDVQNSKPHPETYLKAAACANASPARCLVLEDAFNGIRAGRAAGCIVGMVPDTLPFDETCAPYCDMVFDDLSQVISWIEA